MNTENVKKRIKILKKLRKLHARGKFINFVEYNKSDYEAQEFQIIVCNYLDKLASREILKLMIFLPPQHGKTELSSRNFPAYLFGKNPSEKLILGSYNLTKASEFVTDCQRVMISSTYKELFPGTKLIGKQTANYFEINNGIGFLKAAGMDSGVTGTTATGIIIDDPFKGRNEANSKNQRDKIWKTYSDDFQTRLSNNSFQLMLFTRWHQDDLAGRILDPNNENYDEEEAKEWTVVVFSALKEHEKAIECSEDVKDTRELDDALWESRHSKAKYVKRRRINPTGFASLDQQRPAALEGNKMLREWFGTIDESALPFNPNEVVVDYFIDGAFTENTKNDETALMTTYFHKKTETLYIFNCIGIRKELYELLPFFKTYALQNNYSRRSTVWIEPKASGKPLKSMLSKPEYGGFNVREIPNKVVGYGKWNRVENSEPFLASGKVVLVKGSWTAKFIDQCATYPNATHDDMVDDLCYAIDHYFIKKKSKGVIYVNE